MTLSEVRALIAEYAAQPLKVKTSAADVEMRPLSELLDLEARLAQQESAAAGTPLRFTQILHKGTQG
jgi:hypothetical protein